MWVLEILVLTSKVLWYLKLSSFGKFLSKVCSPPLEMSFLLLIEKEDEGRRSQSKRERVKERERERGSEREREREKERESGYFMLICINSGSR